ncbi:MAG TPA: response regulator [Pirellulales bacterium]|nr:response regulator [Pirellulales bacterium]
MITARSVESSSAECAADDLRILVVEDEQESAERLAAMLAQWHCCAQVFRAGAEAIDRLGEFQPHVALISLSLPDLCGFEVAHRLCDCATARRALLISLSTSAQEHERRLANALGFDFHLLKPIDAEEFRRALDQIAMENGLPLRRLAPDQAAGAASQAAAEMPRRSARPHGDNLAAALCDARRALAGAEDSQPRKLLRLLLLDPAGRAAKGRANWLRRWGFEVDVCQSAEESLERVDSLAPHVIVVATEGLDVDACELAAALRARAGAGAPRLVALVRPGRERALCCPVESDYDLHLSGDTAVRQLGEALSELLAADPRFQ